MKKSIYPILEKHFQQKTSSEEEKQIAKFKEENFQEYYLLKNLWHSEKKVDITNFDSQKAWNKVNKAEQKTSKTISLTPFRRAAAIAIIIIISSFLSYFIFEKQLTPQYTQLTTPTLNTDSIILSDGTTIWLNRNSKLIYPKKFKGKTRRVKLEGEAWFKVTKNAKKPFEVETQYSTITVLGTSFNIDTDSLKTEVCLATGKVNVKSYNNQKSVNLIPKQKAIATPNKLIKSQITNPNYLSWKTGVFLFEDTPLSTVINDLNKYYHKPIKISPDNADLLFTAKFSNTTQADILQILQLTFKLNIHENTNFFEIN